MNIIQNSVVSFHYVLKNEAGEKLESSDKNQPLVYLHGHKAMLAGIETALAGKTAGEKLSVTLPPLEAYGEKKEDSTQRIPIKHLNGAKKWKPNMIATVHTDSGHHQVTIIKVGHTMATVDTNHPFAGLTLTFDIEIVDVKEASAEEIQHGHAHGPGGHQH